MSSAVRHTFHTDSDPAGTGSADIDVSGGPHAFDLFLPEPTGRASTSPVQMSHPAPVEDFSEGRFEHQVVAAIDPPATQPALPLGGIAPTEREIASARAVMVGWFAACAIAAFAFLAQGPSLAPRPAGAQAPPVEVPGSDGSPRPGDIKLVAEPEATTAARPTKSTLRKTAPSQPPPAAPAAAAPVTTPKKP